MPAMPAMPASGIPLTASLKACGVLCT
jgi:hypothetical protein